MRGIFPLSPLYLTMFFSSISSLKYLSRFHYIHLSAYEVRWLGITSETSGCKTIIPQKLFLQVLGRYLIFILFFFSPYSSSKHYCFCLGDFFVPDRKRTEF